MNDRYNKKINNFINLSTGKCRHTPSILASCERIIAIGDIHGDINALILSLNKAGVIDSYNNWIGKTDIVVQVGDILDRGGRGVSVPSTNKYEEIDILSFMYSLNKQAMNVGGRVISLLGNHELMNLLGDFRYASREHINGFGGFDKRKEIFRPGSAFCKKIACNSLGMVKIGGWVFVHGGFLPIHIENLIKSESHLNNDSLTINKLDIKKLLEKKYDNNKSIILLNNLVLGILRGDINIDNLKQHEEDMLFGSDGIFWTRKFSEKIVKDNNCKLLHNTLGLLNNQNGGGLVCGHTPQTTINSACDSKVWRIDVGMSEAFGKRNKNILERIEVLEIWPNKNIVKKI